MNHSIKLNMSKLPGAFKASIQGRTATKACICIPVEVFHEGEKGFYLNLVAFARQEAKYGETHSIKVSVNDEAYKAMSEEERKAIPFIGAMKELARPEHV